MKDCECGHSIPDNIKECWLTCCKSSASQSWPFVSGPINLSLHPWWGSSGFWQGFCHFQGKNINVCHTILAVKMMKNPNRGTQPRCKQRLKCKFATLSFIFSMCPYDVLASKSQFLNSLLGLSSWPALPSRTGSLLYRFPISFQLEYNFITWGMNWLQYM